MSSSPGNENGHYGGDYQPIDFADEFLFPEFHIGNVIKYVVRYKKKGGKQDLLKALWYLNRLVTKGENIGFSIYKSSICANKLVIDIDDYLAVDIVCYTINGNYKKAVLKLEQKIKDEYPDE